MKHCKQPQRVQKSTDQIVMDWLPKRIEKRTTVIKQGFQKVNAKIDKVYDHLLEYELQKDIVNQKVYQLAQTHQKAREMIGGMIYPDEKRKNSPSVCSFKEETFKERFKMFGKDNISHLTLNLGKNKKYDKYTVSLIGNLQEHLQKLKTQLEDKEMDVYAELQREIQIMKDQNLETQQLITNNLV